MKKLFVITAIVVDLLTAGLSAQAGIVSHILGSKPALSFVDRWAPVNVALGSGTFVVQNNESAF